LRVLVLALGNPILGDDGVAFHIIELVRRSVEEGPDLVIDDASVGGIDLLPHLSGFDRALIIDAVMATGAAPGDVQTFTEQRMREQALHVSCTHTTSFGTALELGRRLSPEAMPREIVLVGVQVVCINEFKEDLTPEVDAAVPVATERVLDVLRGWGVPTRQG
jgi:hydrogenase maturation protease